MTEKEIREMIEKEGIDNVNWGLISQCQTLSEDFIREFQSRLDLECVMLNQALNKRTLSDNFIKEFKNRIDWEMVSWMKNSPELFSAIKNRTKD